MSAIVVCPKCQVKLRIEDNAFGKAIKCPGCAALFMVKAPAPAPPPPAPPPRATAPPAPEKKAAGPVPDWAKDYGEEDVSRKARLARKSRKDDEDDDRRKKPAAKKGRDEDEKDDRPKRSAARKGRDNEEEEEDRPKKSTSKKGRDEDEEADEDRGRKPKTKPQGAGLSNLVLILGVVGWLAFLTLALVGFLIWVTYG